ncbi:MAG: PLP-dependent transferase [Symploca sp. SIO2E6]|nr:PLP-dependent transferase [Symploca sp. SIO2E6]
MSFDASLHPSTLAIHADQGMETCSDIAPPIHMGLAFLLNHEENLVYNRRDQPTRQRLENVLGALEGGHAIVYSSGQAASKAVLDHLCPKRIAINRGYFGTYELFGIQHLELISLEEEFRQGDLVWLETPKNPDCEIEDIAYYADKAHSQGAQVLVNNTMATPILQNPLQWGADFCLHSSSKYISGHADILSGCLVVPDAELAGVLRNERDIYGNILGNLETWLLLRSLRTLSVRVKRQCETASQIASWLEKQGFKVFYPSLASHPGRDIAQKQMKGAGGVVSFEMDTQEQAESLVNHVSLFQNAVSYGCVESLIHWTYQWHKNASSKLIRLAIGLEEPEDLIKDLESSIEQTKKELGTV